MGNRNMELYEKFRHVPDEAKKRITGGRLNGMTDINPMWRIKALTEEFGACGFGWYYEIENKWVEAVNGTTEIAAFVEIKLYVKDGNEWSKGIIGMGGSMLSTNEKKGLYVNDEAYKMALTDAISVACKALGVGADVYWNKDTTKYNDAKKTNMQDELNAINRQEAEANKRPAAKKPEAKKDVDHSPMTEKHQTELVEALDKYHLKAIDLYGMQVYEIEDRYFQRAMEVLHSNVKKE